MALSVLLSGQESDQEPDSQVRNSAATGNDVIRYYLLMVGLSVTKPAPPLVSQ